LSRRGASEERAAAIRRLAASNAPEAIRALWESAGDEDPEVAEAALEALLQPGVARLPEPDRPAEARSLVEPETDGVAEDGDVSEPGGAEDGDALAVLRDRLADPDPAVVEDAISELETRGGPEAVAALAELLARPSTSTALKLRAIEAVEWIESADSIPVLRSALWDADLQVAMAAVEAFETFGGRALADPAVDALSDVFRRSDAPALQIRAMEALQWLDGERAVAVTTQVLEDNPEGPLYGLALETLYQLGDHSTIPALRNAYATTQDPGARQVLADLLDMLGEDV
jgi:HEAT repeat protein